MSEKPTAPRSRGKEIDGSRLLDRESPADYRTEWTEHFAAEKTVRKSGTVSVVIFRIGSEWLALPTPVFQEVTEIRKIHSLPHRRDRVVLGVVNIRGELRVCVSLGELLGVENSPVVQKDKATHERLLVANRDGIRLAFPVNEVHGIHRYAPGDMRGAPATLAKSMATYTKGLFDWQKKTVGCLDDELLFYTINRSLS